MLCLIGFELYSRWVPRMLRAFLDKIEGPLLAGYSIFDTGINDNLKTSYLSKSG